MRTNVLGSLALGGVFILCGVSWLVANIFQISIRFDLLWPVFLLIPGFVFWAGYLANRKEWGLVIPGTIFTVLGLLFMLNIFIGDVLGYPPIWAVTAFMYPGSVAIVLWVGWLVSGRKELGLAIGAGITTIVSVSIFCFTSIVLILGDVIGGTNSARFVWPLGFLCLGIFIITSPFMTLTRRPHKHKSKDGAQKIEEAEIISES